MRVLVTTASKRGATREVGDRVAAILADSGHAATSCDVAEVTSLVDVDAVVVGGGIYMGAWIKPGQAFVTKFGPVLGERPRWAFSCGPVGDPLLPAERPEGADGTVALLGCEHRLFPGRVSRAGSSLVDRAVLAAMKVPDGDFRDWADIDRWAQGIAEELDALERVAQG